jgi:hypothetical protein
MSTIIRSTSLSQIARVDDVARINGVVLRLRDA